MKPKSMDLAWITVSDFKKAVDFYTKVLGFKIRELSQDYEWAELVAEGEGVCLGIGGCGKENPIQPGSNAIMTITVDDINKARDSLKNQKVRLIGDIIEIPGHVKIQLFSDFDENHFQLVEKVGH